MQCALCHNDKLLRQSHIVSEFMYGPLYDSKHRFRAFSINPQIQPQIHQKGIRQKLLCDDCEQQLSRYEKYVAENLYAPALRALTPQLPSAPTIALPGLDYNVLKLFFISVLWRFSAVVAEPFRRADLGPHAEKLRKMLLIENPGPWERYPCMVTAATLRGKFYPDVTAGAFSTKAEGMAVWGVVMSGFLCDFFVGSHNPPTRVDRFYAKPGRSFEIAVVDMRDIPSLYEFGLQIGAASLERKQARGG